MKAIERSLVLPRPPDEVWAAVSHPVSVRAWLGRLRRDRFAGGASWILSTDSAEYVRVWVEAAEPGRRLSLRWSEFGVEAPSTVLLRLHAVTGGTRLELRETFPPERAVSRRVREIFWNDCADRLLRHLAGGAAAVPVRPIVLETRLAVDTWLPLHRDNIFTWLPVSGAQYPPTWFYVVDEAGPWRFAIRRVEEYFDERLNLTIDVGEGLTEATLRMRHDGVGVVLSVYHARWPVPEEGRGRIIRLRNLFELTWRASLDKARTSASLGETGGSHGP